MQTKRKKLIPAIFILVLGIVILITTISLYVTEDKNPSKKTKEENESHKNIAYKNLVIEDTSFSYHDGKMYFTATIYNKNHQDSEEETVFLVLKGKNQDVLTEQAMVIPIVKANNKESVNIEFEDVFKNITDYEIKSIE